MQKEGECEQTKFENVCGRRIFDVAFLIKQLKTFGNHTSPFGCNACNMCFKKEFRRGLNSVLLFKCNMCGAIEKVFSEPSDAEDMDVNSAAVRIGISLYYNIYI